MDADEEMLSMARLQKERIERARRSKQALSHDGSPKSVEEPIQKPAQGPPTRTAEDAPAEPTKRGLAHLAVSDEPQSSAASQASAATSGAAAATTAKDGGLELEMVRQLDDRMNRRADFLEQTLLRRMDKLEKKLVAPTLTGPWT
jgi:hypothetical protein